MKGQNIKKIEIGKNLDVKISEIKIDFDENKD